MDFDKICLIWLLLQYTFIDVEVLKRCVKTCEVTNSIIWHIIFYISTEAAFPCSRLIETPEIALFRI